MNNLDAFVAIELIEHLYPEELERLPYNVFHLIRPQIAIFTTPNSDFNILFATLPAQKFRHDDHKFEWSREQFREWADNLTERFPDYSVDVQGIGPAPEGAEEDYGCCSQAAIFVRRPDSAVEINPQEIQEYNEGAKIQKYDIILECDYPFDERSREQKITDCAMYQINRMEHRRRMDREDEYDNFRLEIPLERIVEEVSGEVSTTVEELEVLLKAKNLQIEEGTVIVVSDDEEYDEYQEEFGEDRIRN
uniref:Small RNA 2'-O-methyltransferase n=1 Tax=Phlebotomus papatasi TaxID=29031 RepID=A0A1B0DAK9_PHLPP